MSEAVHAEVQPDEFGARDLGLDRLAVLDLLQRQPSLRAGGVDVAQHGGDAGAAGLVRHDLDVVGPDKDLAVALEPSGRERRRGAGGQGRGGEPAGCGLAYRLGQAKRPDCFQPGLFQFNDALAARERYRAMRSREIDTAMFLNAASSCSLLSARKAFCGLPAQASRKSSLKPAVLSSNPTV